MKIKQLFINEFKSIKRIVWAYQFLILGWLTTAIIVLFNLYPASAQNSNNAGFGDAINKVKGNSIITSAGGNAVDLFSFPFLIAGVFILLIVLYAIISGLTQLLSGRDWITPFIALVGMFAVILLGTGIYLFISNSGLIN